MQIGGNARLVRCALFTAALTAVALAPAVSYAAPAPGTITISQHSKHGAGFYWVNFGLRKQDHGKITGTVASAPMGTPVTLEAKRFPFKASWRTVGKTTTDANGRFHFPVRPILATRYRATTTVTTSRTVTFYVEAGARRTHNRPCSTQPTCTTGSTFLIYYPKSVARTESAKRWFKYHNVTRNCCHPTKPPRTLYRTSTAKVASHRVNATSYRTRFTFHQRVGLHYYYQSWAACQRETERHDGFGVPKHVGPCGARSVASRVFAKEPVG